MLKECLAIPHISTGDMLRESIRRGTAVGSSVVGAMQAGSLVPDQVVNDLVEERLCQPDAKDGFILDGYPRTRAQAEHLCRWLSSKGIGEVVIHLAVDYNIIIARLTGRRQCPRCGTLYNIGSKPPKAAGLCDLDGEKLVIRDDDREEVIRERLDEYDRQTRPVLQFYRESGRPLIEVDGSTDSPKVISDKICETLCEILECDDCPKDRC